MMRDPAKARAIAQETLDATGAAILSGDFAAIEQAFALPALLGTAEGEVTIDTVEALAARFASVRAHHRSLGVTDMVRNIIACTWQDGRTIHTTFQSRLLAGKTLVQAPYTTLANLKDFNGVWKCTSMIMAVPDSDKHNEALLGDTRLGDNT